MRPILHVISGLRTGGAETQLVLLCRALVARGIKQRVVSLTEGGPNAAALARLGVPVDALALSGPTGAAHAVLALARLIRTERPALVQGWLYHGDLFAAAAHRLAGRKSGTRLAWGLRNSDIDDARYGRLIAVARRLSAWPDLVISNSQAGLDFHVSRGYVPRRVAVVANGVDTERFRPDPEAREVVRRQLGLTPTERVALHAARLDPMKDHPTLLAAAAMRPDLRFVLIGKGTERLALPSNALALGRRDDPELIASAADLVVSSSAFGEGFSNALAEGMAAGLVPVATRVGDAAALLGEEGRLVAPGDPGALAAALRDALADPARLRAEGCAARARIVSLFSPDAMANRFLGAWREAGAAID